MSRWLFFLLLLLNVLLVVWGMNRPVDYEPPSPPPPLPRVEVLPWDLPEPPVPPPAPEPLACVAFGPFAEQAPALAFLERLDTQGFQARVRVFTHSRVSGYWVLIPAERVTRGMTPKALAAKGLKDSWRFRRGPLAGALSFGLYARRARARVRVRELAAHDIQAEIRPRRVEDENYLVEVRGPRARLESIEPPPGATGRPCNAATPQSSPEDSQ